MDSDSPVASLLATALNVFYLIVAIPVGLSIRSSSKSHAEVYKASPYLLPIVRFIHSALSLSHTCVTYQLDLCIPCSCRYIYIYVGVYICLLASGVGGCEGWSRGGGKRQGWGRRE